MLLHLILLIKHNYQIIYNRDYFNKRLRDIFIKLSYEPYIIKKTKLIPKLQSTLSNSLLFFSIDINKKNYIKKCHKYRNFKLLYRFIRHFNINMIHEKRPNTHRSIYYYQYNNNKIHIKHTYIKWYINNIILSNDYQLTKNLIIFKSLIYENHYTIYKIIEHNKTSIIKKLIKNGIILRDDNNNISNPDIFYLLWIAYTYNKKDIIVAILNGIKKEFKNKKYKEHCQQILEFYDKHDEVNYKKLICNLERFYTK